MADDAPRHFDSDSFDSNSFDSDSFEIEIALSTWRQFLSRDRAILPEDLDELESHLRDEYAAALAEGLPPRKAYEKARASTGNPGELHTAYRRVESEKRYSRHGMGREARYMSSLARSYVTSGARSLARSSAASIINIVGLSIAVACAVTVYLFLGVYWSLDAFHEKGERIFMVEHVVERNGRMETRGTVPEPLGPAMAVDMPQVLGAVRLDHAGTTVSNGNRSFQERLTYTDDGFFDLFTFPLATGSPDALTDPTAVYLSHETAQRLFGLHDDPVGEQLTLTFGPSDSREVIVAGVAEPFPANAGFDFSVLAGWAARTAAADQTAGGPTDGEWGVMVSGLFVEVADASEFATAALAGQLADYIPRQRGARDDYPIERFVLDNLRNPMPGAHKVLFRPTEAPHPILAGMFVLLAVLMMALSCFNYINISIGLALRRLREIGVRKVMGGTRGQLTAQFMVENLLLCFGALVLGVAGAWYALIPIFNNLFVLQIESGFFTEGTFWLFLVVLLLGTAVLSGAYPAWYVSSFRPVSILGGRTRLMGNAWLTKIFLYTQFFLAFVTILVVVLVAENGRFMRALDWGPEEASSVLYVSVPQSDMVTEVSQWITARSDVERMAGAVHHAGRSMPTTEIEIDGQVLLTLVYRVGRDYLSVMGLDETELTAGRVVVNETFMTSAGWTLGDGHRVALDSTTYEVASVIPDFHINPLSIHRPALFVLVDDPAAHTWLVARAGRDGAPAMLDDIEARWQQRWPATEFDGDVQARVFNPFLESYDNLSKSLGYLGALALLIAAMGLYGLSSQNISRRMKEVAIRKVLGASSGRTLLTVNSAWIRMVIVTGVAATLASLAMLTAGYSLAPEELLLMPITPRPFIIGYMTVLAAALLAMGAHARKVTSMNPALILQSA